MTAYRAEAVMQVLNVNKGVYNKNCSLNIDTAFAKCKSNTYLR